MRRQFLTTIGVAVFAVSKAQIPDIYYVSAATAANLLVGDNVVVSNATFTGSYDQLARFTDGTDKIGFAEGVALTTGKATYAGIDYTGEGADNSWGQIPPVPRAAAYPVDGDPDLNIINGPGAPKSVSILEFDFVSTDVVVQFDMVFASEEYPEWACSYYNDVFGFFLSGPGIAGGQGFTNDAVNMARIPNTNVPISINTVNYGAPGGLGDATICDAADPNWQSNSVFYVDNPFVSQGFITESIAQWVYDGHTTVLGTRTAIQCNQTYHIKIAICNTNDYNLDSGVFLRKGTLTSPYPAPGPLTIVPVPQCEGQPLTLTVGGNPNWTYTWSTGQSGVGLQEITTTANTGTTSYSVTAEYLTGCSLSVATLPGDVVIHSANNTPPLCLGINGNGGYQAYVQAGDQLCFQIPTSDTPNEEVFLSWNGGAPGSFSINGAPQATGTYCWTPTLNDIGSYSFTVTATDNNQCGLLTSECIFDIKVVCDFCPISVFYENRTPGGLPLPALTEAGWRIVAGTDVDPNQTNGPVETGTANVEFRAAEIFLEPGFVAGPNFLAIPDPESCLDDCEACCDNWGGFTVDTYDPDGDGNYELNNWFEPDGDGTYNDFWQVHDADHPYCAYGATAYELTIIPAASSWGNPVYYIHEQPGGCCPFESRAPNHQIPHSSIYWDGTINAGNWNCYGCMVTLDAYYAYILHLYGCNGELTFTGLIYVDSDAVGGMAFEPGDEEAETGREQGLPAQATAVAEQVTTTRSPLALAPNPSSDEVRLTCSDGIEQVEVFDVLRNLVWAGALNNRTVWDLNVQDWSSGTYVFRATLATGSVEQLRFVKQ